MTAEEIIIIRTFINEAYPYVKMDKPEGDDVWFVLLQDYKFKKMHNAVVDHIKYNGKFAPSISDLINRYEANKNIELNEVIQYMDDQGCFDDPSDSPAELAIFNHDNRLRKAMMWINNGTVPDWLQKDINKNYKNMKKTRIHNKKVRLLE